MYTLYTKSYATSRAFTDNAGREYKDFAGGVVSKDSGGNHFAAKFGWKPNPFKTHATLGSGSDSPAMGLSFDTSSLSTGSGLPPPRFDTSGLSPATVPATVATGFDLLPPPPSFGTSGLSPTSSGFSSGFGNSGFGFSPAPTSTVASTGGGLSVLGTPLGTKFLPKRKSLRKSLPKRLTKRSKCLPLPKRKDPPPRPPEEWLEINKRAKKQKVTDTPSTPKGLGLVVEGDIISLCEKGDYDVMIHGCNCFHSMGGGLAAQVKRRHYKAYQSDLATAHGDRTKLGFCSGDEICQNNGHKFFIVNAYTQYHPSSGKGVDVDLNALRNAMRNIKEKFPGKRIAYPRIGCGLAGGNWTEISQIIREELAGENHTLVEYKP